ncbi:quinone oxidoreductase family protein [Limnobacter alexandrii]|uniref:quinone oxidoreductase family protein n=1 Tax=Limnobacter alexandrii TaxID=2570352 RepID=UPI001108C9E0|nr:quinone oxidoreductase [Limnobacter alexandrii]
MSTTAAKIVRFYNPGAPDVLKMEDIEVGPPKAGEVQVEHKAIGLNYIEVYWRTGVYPQPLPCCPGTEGAGIVRAVGEGVTDLKVGDRVAYGSGPVGSYSTVRNMPAHPLMKIPDSIDFETAAAMMLKGFTAQYLLRRVYKVQAGETILFHAAAGGVGTIATQWAKSLGVRVIGTVSTREKAELAKANGCAEVIITSEENIVDRVKELTDGKGVPVVYDSVGKATFMDSLNCLKPRGMMVSFGNASGKVDPVPLQWLAERGSLVLTRPTVASFTVDKAEMLESAAEMFGVVASGAVKIQINQRFALADVVKAHTELEGRRTTGCTVLIP